MISAPLVIALCLLSNVAANPHNLTAVHQWLSTNAGTNLDQLITFLSIPSISADPYRAPQVRRCAEWLADDLTAAGMHHVDLLETGGHPVVYADWLHAPLDAPTVLIYGHYDVQPEDPLDLWTTPPFQPDVRDGKVYARGASDDKGNMYVPLMAIKAFLKVGGGLPVNVKLLLEGEEEIGSPNLRHVLVEQRERFRADYAYSVDGGMVSRSIPSLVLSLRGSLCYEIAVRVADRDMHSGFLGGGVQNPIHVLSRLLSSLRDIESGRILVPGFYDEVDEADVGERKDMEAFPISSEDMMSQNGVNISVGEEGYTFWERISVRPTIEIVGMWGGYIEQGIKTIIPSQAHAKIACRTVPKQDPIRTNRLLLEHFQREAARIPGVTLEIKPEPNEDGAPVSLRKNGTGMQAAARVLTELYNRKPVFIRGGGTIGAVSMIHQILGLETTLFAFAEPDNLAHSPNEFARLESFRRGERAYVQLLHELSLLTGKIEASEDNNGKDEL